MFPVENVPSWGIADSLVWCNSVPRHSPIRHTPIGLLHIDFRLSRICLSRLMPIRSWIWNQDYCPSGWDFCLSKTEVLLWIFLSMFILFAHHKIWMEKQRKGNSLKNFVKYCCAMCIQAFFGHKSGGGNGQNLWAIVLSENEDLAWFM